MSQLPNFRDAVVAVVRSIPEGRVITYGDIAAVCGRPRAARIVGGIAHYGDPNLPWQRVVKAGGHLAEGFPGGVAGHQQLLEAEGIQCSESGIIKDFENVRWRYHGSFASDS